MLQELTRYYNRWKADIDALQRRGAGIPALDVDPARVKQSRVLKLLCSLETKDVSPLKLLLIMFVLSKLFTGLTAAMIGRTQALP